MRHAQGPQRRDAGEAPTRCPSVSSQALYHWATALPIKQSCDLPVIDLLMVMSSFRCILMAINLQRKNLTP